MKIIITLILSIFLISCTENVDSTLNICDPNPCAESQIPNKTVCKAINDTDFTCICETGYELKDNLCIEPFDICNDNPCTQENRTTCISKEDDTYECSCDDNYHLEYDKCIVNIKRVSCKKDNPNKPVNSTEDSLTVDTSWNEETKTWNEAEFCPWTCFKEYKGENCDSCNDNYVMSDDTCVLDCDLSKHFKANNTNDACICIDGYHFDESNNCVETINPCEPNLCLSNDGNSNKTRCKTISQTAGDYECLCEDGYEENDLGICIELTEVHIRAVAGNISTSNFQNYDDGEGIRIFQGLKPNVIMIQEFSYKNNTPANYEEMVKAIFQDPACFQENTCFYSVGLDLDNVHDYTPNGIPNGVISRFPIIEIGSWDDPNIPNRDLDWAILDIPGNKELFTISVHLHTSPSSDQRTAAQVITKKISELKELHPNKYYYIVGGDFNGTSAVSDDGFGEWENETIFDANINDPSPIGEDGSYGTNANRGSRYDWILTSPDLTRYQIPSRFCSETNPNDCKIYSNGLIFDTRDFYQSELDKYFPPTLTGDSEGNTMQHMAIIKDFIITF